jgi:hypothetical protein
MQIGPYTLIEEIGSGGMAQIWLAHRVWPDGRRRSCAIKLPRLSAVTDEALLWQFVEESRLSIKLRHNNIVSVFDVGMHEGLPYLVMDYISGADLAQLTRAQALLALEWSVETAVYVVREIAQGLSHAHDFDVAGVHQQIVHRDVASKNVMIDGTGGVMLTDFGVATSIGTQTSRIHVKGTLAFMAPEHYLGRATPASDVFGLGGILWELLAGRPFRGHLSGRALVEAVVAGAVEPVGRELPPVVQRVLDGMLHPDAGRRITLLEVLVALEDFPSRRRALQKMVSANFGAASRRTGLSKIHFAASKELLDTLTVVKVAGVLPDGPGRALPGQPSRPPIDFAPVAIADTAKVDPLAMAAGVDDEPVGGPQPEVADATLRISGGIAAGPSQRDVLPAGEGRGGTVLLPPHVVMPEVRASGVVELGAPVRVQTQRSLPLHPAAAAGHDHAPVQALRRVPSRPHAGVSDEPVRAMAGQRVLLVAVVVVVAVTVWSVTTWLARSRSEGIDARDVGVDVAPDAVVTAPVEPAMVSTLAPSAGELVSMPAMMAPTDVESTIPPNEPKSVREPDDRVGEQDPTSSEARPESPAVAGPSDVTRSDPPAVAVAQKVTKPKPRAPKPVASVEFTVRRGLVGFAELKLGSGKLYEVPAKGALTLQVTPGTYTIRTRIEPGGAWRTIRHTFFSDTEYAAFLERKGLLIQAQGAK